MNQVELVYRDSLKAFRPPPKLSLSEWADRYAYLFAESSAEAGKWKTLPYQKEILDAITDPKVEQIWVMKSARVGFTLCLNHTIGYFIHQDPTTIMMVQPTIEDAKGYSKENIAPMLENTPVLKGVVSEAKAKDGENTLAQKFFAGGSLSLVGANSPRGFRRTSRRIVLLDEIDSYPVSAGTEGDPVKLAMKRSEYYHNRKIIGGSTPTIKDFSRIEKLFNSTDQRRYFVPCPHCGEYQFLRFPNMKWPKDEPHLAYFECEKNKCKIEHKDKRWMIERGRFIPTNLEYDNSKVIGFHIWAAYSYSPNSTWGHIAAEFLECKSDPELLKTFINTTLGECFEENYSARVESAELYSRCEFYKEYVAPQNVVVLTSGVDVQDNRIEISIWGWGDGEEGYLVTHQVIFGDPSRPELWKQVDNILMEPIKHESGANLYIAAAALDSGGHFTSEVYQYARERRGKHFFAVKGQSQKGKPPIGKPARVDINFRGQALKNGAEVYPVGTDTIKDTLFRRFKISEAGAGCLHFYVGLSTEYFDQLTSEKQVVRFVKGNPVREWVKKSHARNEALDCLVYAYSALNYLYMRKNRKTMFAQYKDALSKLPKTPTIQEEIKTNKAEIEPNNTQKDKNMLELQKIRSRPIMRKKGFINNW